MHSAIPGSTKVKFAPDGWRWPPLAILVLCALWLAGNIASASEVGTVKVSDLSLRSGPGKQFRVLGHLTRGTRFRVLGRDHGWLKIDHNGSLGFVYNHPRYVSLMEVNERESNPRVDGAPELKDLNAKAETINRKLEASRSELAGITDKERAVIDELDAAEETLNRVRQQVHDTEASLEKIDAQIGRLQANYDALEEEIASNEAHAAKRLVALYKLSWVGRIHLLATADSFFDFIRRKSALEKILHQDETLLDKLNQDQTAVENLLEQLNTRKAEKHALELALTQRMKSLDAEQRRRNGLLTRIRGEKKLAVAALDALKSASRQLDSTMAGLREPETTVPAPMPENDQGPFGTYKGLLPWPVRGKILSFFGPYRDQKYDVTNFQRGIDIQAERGEPIRAVADGYAIFAKWFKGFGNMIIIDHGDHYYTVYAHLEEIFKVKGDRVEKGEVIATVGDTGSLLGPALHFEVRHRGEPLDPLAWINKG